MSAMPPSNRTRMAEEDASTVWAPSMEAPGTTGHRKSWGRLAAKNPTKACSAEARAAEPFREEDHRQSRHRTATVEQE
eukprot:5304736-Lingulodinium_polyedra.AAC.1